MVRFQIYLVIGILLTATCYANDVSFEVTVDKDKVSLSDSVELNLSFHGTQEVPTPYFPDIDGFNWRYLGPSTRMSIINGKVSSSITHRYKLMPLRVGTLEIPSFSIQFRGETYTSEPVSIEVVQGPVRQPQARQPQTYEEKIQGLDDMMFLTMEADKKRAYVNEVVPLTIKLYATGVTLRDIQYPEFAHDGFLVDEFAQPPKQYQEVLNGLAYSVIEFNTNVFGLRPGELKLGPAQTKCNLLVKERAKRPSSLFDDDFFGPSIFGDFFDRYESYPLTLDSIDLPITIVDLPKDNMPEDFNGALGNYNFYLEAEPKEVKVGDPITLKMTITGDGNFKTVKAPALGLGDDFKVYEPEAKQEQGKKTFEQVVIPRNEKITEIPEVNFSFFDTKSEKYKKITKGPIGIKVNPLAKGERLAVFELSEEGVRTLREREILGRDIIFIKDVPGRLKPKGKLICQNRLFLAVQFIPLLAIISVLAFQRRRERLSTDIRYARLLRAKGRAKKNLLNTQRLLDSAQANEFFDAVFKTLQEYLGDKFHMPSAGITANVIEELKLRKVNQQTLDKLQACFNSCDTARYALASITKDVMQRTFNLLQEIIVELERMRIR